MYIDYVKRDVNVPTSPFWNYYQQTQSNVELLKLIDIHWLKLVATLVPFLEGWLTLFNATKQFVCV